MRLLIELMLLVLYGAVAAIFLGYFGAPWWASFIIAYTSWSLLAQIDQVKTQKETIEKLEKIIKLIQGKD